MQNNVFRVRCVRIGRRKAYDLYFPYNTQLVEKIKSLPKDYRKWVGKKKTWEVKVIGLVKLLEFYKGSDKIFFDFGESKNVFIEQLKEFKNKERERKKLVADLEEKKKIWNDWKSKLEKEYLKYSPELHSYLKEGVKLYPHQIIATLYLNEARNALISHEMGLGKSLSTIAYSEMNKFQKVLVITPNSLKFNYYYEVEKFTESKAHVVNWKKNEYSLEESKYIIVNYEYFNSGSRKRMDKKWKDLGIDVLDAVIADECTRLKNTSSNTYLNFKRIFKKNELFRNGKPSKVFLSGTPAPNRAYELFAVLNQISYLDFPTKTHFYEHYLGMKYVYEDEDNKGWENVGQSYLEELYHKISPYTHRKRKKEVLTELPDKIYQRVILEMSDKDMKTYDDIECGLINDFVEDPTSNPLTIMLRLRQYTSHLKVKGVCELIDNILDTGEKIIVVDMFKDSLIKLYEKYKNISGLHTGDQTVEERQEVVKQFQDPESSMKIFFGSIQTCNYGLTLTAASKMFLLSLPYVPGEYDQVSDRCHRIGQKNVVNIYPLIFPNTIDDYVYSSIEEKRREINKVIDNEDYTSNIEESVLNEVIEKIREKHGR